MNGYWLLDKGLNVIDESPSLLPGDAPRLDDDAEHAPAPGRGDCVIVRCEDGVPIVGFGHRPVRLILLARAHLAAGKERAAA